MKKIITLCLILSLTSACGQTSNKLNSETALQILKANFKETCKAEVVSYFSSFPNNPNYNHYEYYFTELKRKGLVDLSKRKYKNGKLGLKIQYTDLATKLYGARPGFSSFKADLLKFYPIEIIGISHHSGNKADVLFKGDMKPTIFNNIRSRNSKCKELKGVQRKITFVRYDTGWRLD